MDIVSRGVLPILVGVLLAILFIPLIFTIGAILLGKFDSNMRTIVENNDLPSEYKDLILQRLTDYRNWFFIMPIVIVITLIIWTWVWSARREYAYEPY